MRDRHFFRVVFGGGTAVLRGMHASARARGDWSCPQSTRQVVCFLPYCGKRHGRTTRSRETSPRCPLRRRCLAPVHSRAPGLFFVVTGDGSAQAVRSAVRGGTDGGRGANALPYSSHPKMLSKCSPVSSQLLEFLEVSSVRHLERFSLIGQRSTNHLGNKAKMCGHPPRPPPSGSCCLRRSAVSWSSCGWLTGL